MAQTRKEGRREHQSAIRRHEASSTDRQPLAEDAGARRESMDAQKSTALIFVICVKFTISQKLRVRALPP